MGKVSGKVLGKFSCKVSCKVLGKVCVRFWLRVGAGLAWVKVQGRVGVCRVMVWLVA